MFQLLIMNISLSNAFLQESKRDLQAARLLVDGRLYSLALYHLEQSLEKGSKALYTYYSIMYDNLSERKVYSIMKRQLSHNSSKTIPEIYCKICDIEESNIDKLSVDNLEIARLKLDLYEGIARLRISIHKLKHKITSRALADWNNLINNYSTEVEKAYQNYKKLSEFIEQQAQNILKEKGLTGTNNVGKVNPFLTFIALSRTLFPCILMKADLYRYPDLDFQNENLRILNSPSMESACRNLIEMMEDFIKSIPFMMKEGLLSIHTVYRRSS
jgi:HEPN domain-containing protein